MSKSNLKTALLALGGTLLYGLAMPPIGWWFAAPAAIALVVYSGLGRFSCLWGLGFLLHLTLYAWLANVSIMALVGLSALAAAFWAFNFWLFARWKNSLGVAAVWVTLELVRTYIGWGWLPLAASFTGAQCLLQVASLGGQGLLGLLIAWFGFNFGYLWHLDERPRFVLLRVMIIVALVWKLVGMGLCEDHLKSAGSMRVAFVQPANPMRLDSQDKDYLDDLERLRQTTNTIKDLNPNLVLWPEQVTPWPVNTAENMRRWVGEASAYLRAPILTGVLWQEGEDFYNAAAVVKPAKGLQPAFYAKRRLVPFGEFIPFAQFGWMRSLTPIVESFTPGRHSVLLEVLPDIRTLPMICYEDSFPMLAHRAVKKQADFITVLTNDAWFGKMGAHQQHAAHSILRAVEQGIPVLRVANDGYSGVITPKGVATWVRGANDDATARTADVLTVRLEHRKTPYGAMPRLWNGLIALMAVSLGLGRWLQLRPAKPTVG